MIVVEVIMLCVFCVYLCSQTRNLEKRKVTLKTNICENDYHNEYQHTARRGIDYMLLLNYLSRI